MESRTVLVTGASGYLGSWIVAAALRAGLRVRGTVRGDIAASNPRLAHLFALPGASAGLELVHLDLIKSPQADFDAAVRGCELVVHAASPIGVSRHPESELVQPAIAGTLKMLEACAEPGSLVERVVVTSSAITVGRSPSSKVVQTRTDEDTNDDLSDGYSRSKIKAEQAVWAFRASRKPAFVLTTMNPTFFFGPSLTPEARSSLKLFVMLAGPSRMPMLPHMAMAFLDVRDVAQAHISALLVAKELVDGRRFILCESKPVWIGAIAESIAKQFGEFAYKTPSRYFPDFVIRFAGLFSAEAAMMAPRLGILTEYDTRPAREVLGFNDRGLDRIVRDTMAFAIESGLVAKTDAFAHRSDKAFAAWKAPEF